MANFKKNQKGYAILITTFFVLIIALSIALGMSSLIFYRQKISTNAVVSTQSYYTAEAGIEDALLRLKNNPQMSPLSYVFNVNGSAASVNIPAIIGSSRTVTSQGSKNGIQKNIQVTYGIDTYNTNFYYGIEVGAGGLQMGNSSEVKGNVFSNGNISGSGTIDNDVVISGNGNSINGGTVGGNVLAYSCVGTNVSGTVTCVTGGTCTCKTPHNTQGQEISQQPMPIPQSQIDAWKQEGAAGQLINGNYSISGSSSVSLGPAKINGDLTVSNSAVLTLTGTVYVTGNVVFQNTSQTKLSSSYGTTGGAIIADGTITTQNSAGFAGSGQTGSYLLLLSTSASDEAIKVQNSSSGAVFYTSAGAINIQNSASILEVTGYKVIMGNNCTIQYSVGVENIYFSNGPGGSWKVTNWQEN